MENLKIQEFASIRASIRERGTLRPILFIATVGLWAILILWLFTSEAIPLATIFPLLVLAAGFEALYALHVNVERIGRYLQVEYEESGLPDAPTWETRSMQYGQRFRGKGPHPLFVGFFIILLFANFLPVALSGLPPEQIGLGAAHLAFAARILLARQRCAVQRAEDLERFRSLATRP